ncbi:hypothetical protein Tco_1549174 [Tanacetum coccineum]
MIDCLSIVETDKVNHAVETDIVKLVVEIKSFGMSADELDKETGSFDGLQPKQADLSCVHALNKLHLHEIHVVLNIHAILHLQRRLFESRECLLLVSRDDIDSKEFTIYEMVKGYPVWTVSHYKVVQAGGEAGETWIQIYSLETGNWSFCRDRSSYFSFDHFESAIYWNDAFHWLEGLNRELKHCKLNMEDHDHPIMTSLEIAHGLHRGRNFLESFGGPINDPILLLMELPHMLRLEGKFFESCG